MSDQSSVSQHKRFNTRYLLLLLLITLISWRVYTDRDYWTDAWNQKSLSPTDSVSLANQRPPTAGSNTKRVARHTFDLSNTTIPRAEILSGGPPKDGIPALSNPKFLPAAAATYLQPTDRIIGISVNNEARAYPLRILNYHEIVNDRLADIPIAVTYCPLCDSCAVFDRRTPQGETEFGVSGLLYNSNVLMYDRTGKTASLWSQLAKQAISGPVANKSLKALPLELTTWKDWQTRHPNTKVLSTETGHHRNYNRSPYADYFKTPRLMFPAQPSSDRLSAKERILAVWTDQGARAYPESAFSPNYTQLADTLNGKKISIVFDLQSDSLRVIKADKGIHWLYSLWFAWYAMHPETEVYTPPKRR